MTTLLLGARVWVLQPSLVAEQTGDVETVVEQQPDGQRLTTRTPAGEFTQFTYMTDLAHQIREFPMKTIADLPVLEYLLRHTQYRWDAEAFASVEGPLVSAPPHHVRAAYSYPAPDYPVHRF